MMLLCILTAASIFGLTVGEPAALRGARRLQPSLPPCIALETHHGTWLTVRPSAQVVAAAATSPGASAIFRPSFDAEGQLSLQGANGKWLVAEPDTRVLADRTAVGPWERFSMTSLANSWIALKSHHNKYLVAEPNGEVKADRLHLGPWEKFRVVAQSCEKLDCPLTTNRIGDVYSEVVEDPPHTITCRPGFEKPQWSPLCFPKCRSGFNRIEGVGCVEGSCRSGYTQALAVCSRTQTRGPHCTTKEDCVNIPFVGRKCVKLRPECKCPGGWTSLGAVCVKHHTYTLRVENAGVDFAKPTTKSFHAVQPRVVPSQCHAAGYSKQQPQRFTVIFLADLEAEYRKNSIDDAKAFIQKIADLTDRSVQRFSTIDPATGMGYRVMPELVIHGGDMSADFWNCHADSCDNTNRYADVLKRYFKKAWSPLYEKGIPMVTGLGNHDWLQKLGHELDPDHSPSDFQTRQMMGIQEIPSATFEREAFFQESNMKSVQAARESYRLAQFISPHFSYEEFAPTKKYGQVTMRAEYKGVQIVDFSNHPFQPSYDFKGGCAERNWHKCQEYTPGTTQFEALTRTLDENKPAIFVQHHPMNKWGTDFMGYCSDANACSGYTAGGAKDSFLNVVKKFNNGGKQTGVFSGHNHAFQIFTDVDGSGVTEYQAPYPLKAVHAVDLTKGILASKGFLALLMDPESGLVEVKHFDL